MQFQQYKGICMKNVVIGNTMWGFFSAHIQNKTGTYGEILRGGPYRSVQFDIF